jgi:hypothetical protein
MTAHGRFATVIGANLNAIRRLLMAWKQPLKLANRKSRPRRLLSSGKLTVAGFCGDRLKTTQSRHNVHRHETAKK